jgi:magnesium chelatase family protein
VCTPPQIQRYVSKVSGPLLDRIDIHIEVPAVQYKELRGSAATEGSAEIRARVLAARERQHARLATTPSAPSPTGGLVSGHGGVRAGAKSCKPKIFSNAQMTTQQIRTFCELSTDAERLLERAMQQQGLSARAHDRILKVARTIADLDAAPDIAVRHLAEAIQYRALDRSYWA